MKPFTDTLGPHHADLGWKVNIAPQRPGTRFSLNRWVKMNHLLTGVHAGIGSPSAINPDGRISHTRKCAFHSFLKRGAGGLALPALKIPATVFDACCYSLFRHAVAPSTGKLRIEADGGSGHGGTNGSASILPRVNRWANGQEACCRSSSAWRRCSSLPSAAISSRIPRALLLSPNST